MRARWAALLFAAAALLLAGVGAVDKADHMTAWVIDLCAQLSPSALFSVFHLPPPMNAWGLRPLSLAVMQGYIAVFGPEPAPGPPTWLIALKAASGAMALAAAARAWLRAHGLAAVAEPAAVLALLGGANLFSAWYLTELDAWGAAATLGATALLRRPQLAWRRRLAVAALLAFAMLLKESSALVTLAFLGGSMAAALVQRRWALAARQAAPALLCALLWLALASPLLGQGAFTSMVGSVPTAARVPILEHNLAQLVYLVTPTGAALIGLLGLWHAWPARAARVRWLLAPLAALALLLMPLISRFSHFETIYYAHHGASVALSLAVLGGLMATGLLTARPGLAVLCGSVAGCQIVMAAAVLGSSSLREDFAARLFLAAAPLLIALALLALRTIRRHAAWTAALLAAALLWSPLAGFFNHALLWRARQGVDWQGRQHLVQTAPFEEDAVVLLNNFQEWLGPEELGYAVPFWSVPVPALLAYPALPTDDMGWTGTDLPLQAHLESGGPTWLYWLAVRSEMDPTANAALRGDLSWIRRPLGALAPLRLENALDSPLPAHNFSEDALLTTYHDGPTGLEQLASLRGVERFSASADVYRLPEELLSVPRRLLAGVPVVERYTAQARIIRFHP